MNRKWIRQNLDCLANNLAEHLPSDCTREFDPTKEFYNRLFQTTEFSSVVQELCSHINLSIIPDVEIVGDSEIPLLDLQSDLRFFDKVIDSAGDYSSKTLLAPKIRIGASHFRRVHSFGCILAHEIAHHYLHSKLIRLVTESENEMLTDLTAIYLGFGKLMLNGAADEPQASFSKPIRLSMQGITYLGYPLLSYAYYLCQTKRGAEKNAIYAHLKNPSASMVKAFAYHQEKKRGLWIKLLEVFGLVPRLPNTNGTQIIKEAWRLDKQRYRIIKCVGCGANLKIPKKEHRIKVRCPKCEKQFQVGIRYK